MTIAYRCDGPDCATLMDDEVTKISLTVEKKIEPQTFEPDEDGMLPTIEIQAFGLLNDRHFCSMACLSAWAFAKQLDATSS
jgi:hypothetical protein